MDCYQYAQQVDLLVNVRPRNSRQSVLRTIKLMEHAVPLQSLEQQAAEECEQWFGRQVSEHSEDYKLMLEFVIAEHYAFKRAIFETFQEPEPSFVVVSKEFAGGSRLSSIASAASTLLNDTPQYVDYKVPLKEIDTNLRIPHRRQTMVVKKNDRIPLDTVKNTNVKPPAKRRRQLSMQELFSSDEEEYERRKKAKSPRYSKCRTSRAASTDRSSSSSSARFSFMNPTKSSIARSSRK